MEKRTEEKINTAFVFSLIVFVILFWFMVIPS